MLDGRVRAIGALGELPARDRGRAALDAIELFDQALHARVPELGLLGQALEDHGLERRRDVAGGGDWCGGDRV